MDMTTYRSANYKKDAETCKTVITAGEFSELDC